MTGTRRVGGYTLLELMVVVAVIGVLAAVAIPSYRAYLQRSRTAEAITFLGEIRQRQESYRAEFGQYCSASAAPGTGIAGGAWNPTAMPAGGEKIVWDGAADSWDQLGAAPDGPTYFQYRTTAGAPGTAPGVPGYDGSDFWFVSQARADLDGDGETVTFESYSASNHIYIGDDGMNPLPAGWE